MKVRFILAVAEKIAELQNKTIEEVAAITTDNANEIFYN